MIAHLSSEQVAEFVLGQPEPAIVQHVEGCSVCRAELAAFREALGEFRGTVRAWSEHQANAAIAIPPGPVEEGYWTGMRQLTCALAIAAVCILVSLVFPWLSARKAPAFAASDAILLNQVDAQVSRTVPSSMEPLMNLVVQINPSAQERE